MKEYTLTTKDLMRIHDKTIGTIYNWIKAGVPYTRENEGRRLVYKFNDEEVKEWLKNNTR